MSVIISVTVIHKPTGNLLKDHLIDPDLFGIFDGEICGRFGCNGNMVNVNNNSLCTCFYSAPCNHCMNPHTICNTCGFEYKEENNI